MDAKRREVGSLVRWLRKHFPTAHPIRVHWYASDSAFENKGATAETVTMMETVRKQPHSHLVRVRESRSTEAIMQAMIDEWAHALREQLPIPVDEENPHDAIWGAIYAAIWSKWTAD